MKTSKPNKSKPETELRVVALFTDFGGSGPYIGQLEVVIYQSASNAKIINLVSDAPVANPKSSAYLLAALAKTFMQPTVFLAVVDPGVGGERLPVVLQADGHYFVGPDNGLLNTVTVQSQQCQWQQIIWQPEHCSSSFHGRDIFAPIVADLINNNGTEKLVAIDTPESVSDWSADLPEVIYIDHYGNAMTGLRFNEAMLGNFLSVNGHKIAQAQTFFQVPIGIAFWYQNSCGLVEIAVNRGRAQQQLRLEIGMPISFSEQHIR
mgnify:CR=1 FL=1